MTTDSRPESRAKGEGSGEASSQRPLSSSQSEVALCACFIAVRSLDRTNDIARTFRMMHGYCDVSKQYSSPVSKLRNQT